MKKLIILLVVLLSFRVAAAQDYTIETLSIDGGGELVTTGGDYLLGGTAGQPTSETSEGGDYTLSAGIWSENAAIPLTIALSGASATVQTIFYVSLLLLILGVGTGGVLWRHARTAMPK